MVRAMGLRRGDGVRKGRRGLLRWRTSARVVLIGSRSDVSRPGMGTARPGLRLEIGRKVMKCAGLGVECRHLGCSSGGVRLRKEQGHGGCCKTCAQGYCGELGAGWGCQRRMLA